MVTNECRKAFEKFCDDNEGIFFSFPEVYRAAWSIQQKRIEELEDKNDSTYALEQVDALSSEGRKEGE